MSFQEQGDASGERRGFSKFIRRASRALRPKSMSSEPTVAEGTQEQATVSSAAAGPVARSQAPSDIVTAIAAAQPAAATTITTTTTPMAPPAEPMTPSRFASMNVHRSGSPSTVAIPRPEVKDIQALGVNQEEKARLLFAKYGLTLDSRDWTGPSRSGAANVTWVEKKVRMRVHRQCHHCSTSFAASKECANCNHVRCKKCPRFPPKAGVAAAPTEDLVDTKKEVSATAAAAVAPAVAEEASIAVAPQFQDVEMDEQAAVLVAPPVHVQIDPVDQTDNLLLRPTTSVSRRRGNDVVYRPVNQRVRRFCHKCETMFKGRSTVCESCSHQRCPNCPREPAKPSKFPTGYPGDVAEPEPTYPALERVWRKPRTRVRYTCEQCHTVFTNSGEKQCRSCKHARCGDCIRYPPRKPATEHSEELLKTLEGKFVGLQLLSSNAAAQQAAASSSAPQEVA